PIVIAANSFRLTVHEQHDAAEYVPQEMRACWKTRDPVAVYERFLLGEKLLDAKNKEEIEDKIDTLLAAEREFAEHSPMPPPEFTETGVYCSGDHRHKIRAKRERPISDGTPPRARDKGLRTLQD